METDTGSRSTTFVDHQELMKIMSSFLTTVLSRFLAHAPISEHASLLEYRCAGSLL